MNTQSIKSDSTVVRYFDKIRETFADLDTSKVKVDIFRNDEINRITIDIPNEDSNKANTIWSLLLLATTHIDALKTLKKD